MIVAINYANDKYKPAQKFNSKRALKFGADKVIEYSPEKLSEDFVKRNWEIFKSTRGGGYWVWKPYIIKDALEKTNDGDYVIYTDSGSAFVNKIQYLIAAMEENNTDVMCFSITHIEKKYTKRDVFLLMQCDVPEITDSFQICGTYIVIKKSAYSCQLINEYLRYVQDIRIVSDRTSVLGGEYPEFVENRHDQSVWSCLCKKYGIKPFRDPSEYGMNYSIFPLDVIKRSKYPQVIESHRNPDLCHFYQLNYKKWYRLLRSQTYIEPINNWAMKCKKKIGSALRGKK